MMSIWDRMREWLAESLAAQAAAQKRASEAKMAESLGMFMPFGADEMITQFYGRERPRPATSARPAQPVRVVINPGHALDAPGAQGAHINEAAVTGLIGDRMPAQSDDWATYEVWRQQGTRLGDVQQGLHANRPPIVVSIHLDSGLTTDRTIKVIYRGNDPDPVRLAHSQRLSGCVAAALARIPGFSEYTVIGIPDRRVRHTRLAILQDTATDAAIVVEVGFITNPETEAFAQTPEGQQAIANGLREGVSDYLRGLEPTPRPAPAQGRPPAARPALARPAVAPPAAARPAPAPPRAPGAPAPPQPSRGRNGRRGR